MKKYWSVAIFIKSCKENWHVSCFDGGRARFLHDNGYFPKAGAWFAFGNFLVCQIKVFFELLIYVFQVRPSPRKFTGLWLSYIWIKSDNLILLARLTNYYRLVNFYFTLEYNVQLITFIACLEDDLFRFDDFHLEK